MVRNIINTRAVPSRPMAGVTPFTPLTRVIEQLFEDPFVNAAMARSEHASMLPLDVSETDREFIVRGSLPGFETEEVDVEFNEGVLTVRAEKSEEETNTNERWLRRERRWGAVERKIVLPAPVQESGITAEFKNGVLELRLPKVQKAAPKKIQVKGGEQETNSTGAREEASAGAR